MTLLCPNDEIQSDMCDDYAGRKRNEESHAPVTD